MTGLLPGLSVAGVAGMLVAVFVLRPILPYIAPGRPRWIAVAAAGVGLTLLLPTTLLVFDQTRYFHARHLTEVGSAAFEEPPIPEAVARSFEEALDPRDSWASVTVLGRCADVDLYLFYWLAFRSVPNAPDCAHPDVELYWKVAPPRDATIVDRGPNYAVVRP